MANSIKPSFINLECNGTFLIEDLFFDSFKQAKEIDVELVKKIGLERQYPFRIGIRGQNGNFYIEDKFIHIEIDNNGLKIQNRNGKALSMDEVSKADLCNQIFQFSSEKSKQEVLISPKPNK